MKKPDTVAHRILKLQAETGGFGHLTIVSYDASGEEEAWSRSLQLLVNDVLPRCRANLETVGNDLKVAS